MSPKKSPTIKLNNSIEIPILGFGTYKLSAGKEAENATLHALKVGYRHIDTAQFYRNEEDIGAAIKESDISRKEIFVTSKLSNPNFGYESAKEAFEESLEKIDPGGYIDLFLLHWPVHQLRIESWKSLEEVLESGKVKAIGVSNFTIEHLEELMSATKIVPAVNQVEFSPFLYQKKLHKYCKKKGIALESYSPLTQGKKLENSTLIKIGNKYGKTPAQILIRWATQHDIIVIPKSKTPSRIEENFDIFDFEINKADMAILDGLDENFRNSWDPTDPGTVKKYSSAPMRKLSKIALKIAEKLNI